MKIIQSYVQKKYNCRQKSHSFLNLIQQQFYPAAHQGLAPLVLGVHGLVSLLLVVLVLLHLALPVLHPLLELLLLLCLGRL